MGIVWIVDDMESLFVRESSVRSPLTRWGISLRSKRFSWVQGQRITREGEREGKEGNPPSPSPTPSFLFWLLPQFRAGKIPFRLSLLPNLTETLAMQASGGYLIRFDQILGPLGGALNKNSSEKSNAPHMRRGLPLGLNIDRS